MTVPAGGLQAQNSFSVKSCKALLRRPVRIAMETGSILARSCVIRSVISASADVGVALNCSSTRSQLWTADEPNLEAYPPDAKVRGQTEEFNRSPFLVGMLYLRYKSGPQQNSYGIPDHGSLSLCQRSPIVSALRSTARRDPNCGPLMSPTWRHIH